MKVIIFDLETLPDLPAALKEWCALSNFPGRTLKASITSVICAGWKELGTDKPVQCINAWDFPEWEINQNDDSRVVKALYDVLCDADMIITHNGMKFDLRYLQTRLMLHGLAPLPPIHHVDTRQLLSRKLYLFSASLKHATNFYKMSIRKMDHGEGWDLWVDVHAKKPEAMKLMTEYCKQDVLALEQLYYKLRPLANNTQQLNHNLFNVGQGDKHVCPTCGGTRLQNKGYRHTTVSSYKRYKCLNETCGAYSRVDMKDRMPRSFT